METNEIKAGTYLLVAPFWDEYLSKPGEPFDFKRHRRGEVLDLNVEDARRLVLAGAVLPHDPDAPTHRVNADGSVSEIPKPDPAAQAGLVITEELMAQLGIPADATSEDVVKAIAALQQSAADAEAKAAAAATDRPKSDKIEDILEWVGSDPAKASTALEGEKTTKGDKARPSLVTSLEEILTNPGGS